MKTRSLKELFEIILENEYLFASGLCGLIYNLLYNDTITLTESIKLIKYIDSHRPKRGKHYDKSCGSNPFYWPIYSWSPREAWLRDQIKKLT